MTKTNVESISLAPKKILILIVALALIAVSALLCLVKGISFSAEFGGGASVTVTFAKDAAQADLDQAVKAVKSNCSASVLSARIFGTNGVIIRTTPVNDEAKLKEGVKNALSLGDDSVSVAGTNRYVDKQALISIGVSLLIAGGIVLVYFAVRYGILPAVGTLFGFIVTAAAWILPYTLGVSFDYKAFIVLAVGLAAFVIQSSLVYRGRIRRASDLNVAPALMPVILLTASAAVLLLVLGLIANLWAISLPLIFVLAGAGFSALLASGACVLMFKK